MLYVGEPIAIAFWTELACGRSLGVGLCYPGSISGNPVIECFSADFKVADSERSRTFQQEKSILVRGTSP